MVNLVCVDPDSLPDIWGHVSPLIRRAMRDAVISSFEHIEKELFSDKAQLWIVWDGQAILCAGITQLYKDKGVCLITACGGESREKWLHVLPEIEAFAKAEGCTRTMIIGRKGWLRELKDYRLAQVILEKELM